MRYRDVPGAGRGPGVEDGAPGVISFRCVVGQRAGGGRGRGVEVFGVGQSFRVQRGHFRAEPDEGDIDRVGPGVVSQFGGEEPGQVHAPFGVPAEGQVPDVFEVEQPLLPGLGVPDRHQSRVRRVVVAIIIIVAQVGVGPVQGPRHAGRCDVPRGGWVVVRDGEHQFQGVGGEPGGDHIGQPREAISGGTGKAAERPVQERHVAHSAATGGQQDAFGVPQLRRGVGDAPAR